MVLAYKPQKTSAANSDRKVSLARRASTQQKYKHSISGNVKTGHLAPKKITLPHLKFMDIPLDDK